MTLDSLLLWCRFRLLLRYLTYRPLEVRMVYNILDLVSAGCRGHGRVHLLVQSAGVLGFVWDPGGPGWLRAGLPFLSHLAGPYQHFKAAVWDAWRAKVFFDLCRRQGFQGEGLGWTLLALYSSCVLRMLEIEIMHCSAAFFLEVCGMDFSSAMPKEKSSLVVFCGGFDGDGHLLWDCAHLPWVQIRENPEFHDLIQRDKSHWPRCLLWHGLFPSLAGLGAPFRWAVGPGQAARNRLESSLGVYSGSILREWVRRRLGGACLIFLTFWTDGSIVREEVSGACFGGTGVYAHISGSASFRRSWVIWICFWLTLTLVLNAVGCIIPCLVHCSPFSARRFGEFFLHCSVPKLLIFVSTT